MFSTVNLDIFDISRFDSVTRFTVSINDADAVEFPTVLLGECLRHRTIRISREFLDIILSGPSVDTLGVVTRLGEIVLVVEFGVDQLLCAVREVDTIRC
jgi:hypothetical protein